MSAVSAVDTFMLLDQLQVSEYRSPEIELGSREATDDEWWLFVGVLVVVWAAVLATARTAVARRQLLLRVELVAAGLEGQRLDPVIA